MASGDLGRRDVRPRMEWGRDRDLTAVSNPDLIALQTAARAARANCEVERRSGSKTLPTVYKLW